MWYVILHMTFVFSAVLLGVLDKMSFAKHRDIEPRALGFHRAVQRTSPDPTG